MVADEIRKLSETSSVQSKTIGEELEKITNSINDVVSASQTSSKSFSTVKSSISQTQQLVTQIQGAMEEQQEGSKQIYRDTGNTLSEIANSVEAAVGQIGDQIDLFTV